MPDPSTTRLGLYKSKSDGSELVNYTQDIGQNLDKLDAAAGFQIVTSSTRPSSPYPGKPITESNTSYRTYFSNGTVPASGSWVEIPNSSGTFGSSLTIAQGKAIDIGGAANGGGYGVLGSATTSDVLYAKVSGESVGRFYVSADGAHQWGSGTATRDTNLYRSAVNTLKTDDSFVVGINLTVAGSGSITGSLAAGNFAVVVDWTSPALASGYTGDGNSNGTPQYRVINVLGTQFVQWRGGINATYSGSSPVNGGMPFSANLPASARPASRRSMSCACSAASSTSLSIKIDFNTDGSLQIVGGTGITPPWIAMNLMYSL
ncbi:hypothetical protein [Streptomyces spinosisporus]|uniref:Tail fiber protein n=1 Tax=Streptomyces spinosisporus TaxID=2927582 RepID=A0ABS9XW30_9ACTN|nr:hypothetical protein [Streptomyces spinosisporus]MCI3246298.1 hypothetical protein [Streptomyces spinosisporus]